MFALLPKDIVWMIIKQHLTDILKNMNRSLHVGSFYCTRELSFKRTLFEKTYSKSEETIGYPASYLVDWLYPLRLICKRIDALLKEKITKVAIDGNVQQFMIKVAV